MREGWCYKKLGEVATYVNGFAFKPEQWTDEGMPIVRIQNLNNPSAPYNYCTEKLSDQYLIKKGDILISWSASLGAYEWQQDDAYLNQHIFKVVFDKLPIDKYYLKYAVESRLEDMKKQVHGATMQHITKKNFDNILIPYPEVSTQQQIVSELDLLSHILDQKRQQLKEYDALAESIFYDMFGDPVDNPKGWEICSLDSITDVRDGTHDSPKYLEHSDYILITSKNIVNGEISFENINYISEEDYNNINKRSFVETGDIIMAMIGTIGNPIIVKRDRNFCVKNVAIIKFCDATKVINIYIKALLDNASYFKYLTSLNKGGTQKFVALGTLRKLPIPLPPLDLQRSFAAKIESIEHQKQLLRASIKETEMLFQSRMDYWFNS